MPRYTLISAFVVASLVPAADPPPTIPAKLVTLANPSATAAEVATAIREQTGIAVDVSRADAAKKFPVTFSKTPFWVAVERLAADTGCRVATSSGGKDIVLMPLAAGGPPPPSAVDGPFRIALKQIVTKIDFESGRKVYQLHLEVTWEPRFPVYLTESEPRITTVTAGGKAVTADQTTGRSATTGYSHPLTITLLNVPRDAKTLDVVTGKFDVIAAHRILPFAFDDLTADKPVTKEQDGVAVTLSPVKHASGRVEFRFALKYPPGPALESFEEVWASSNKLRVTAANGRDTFEPTDYSTDSRNGVVTGGYSFAGPNNTPGPLPKDLKGWKAIYETPSPLLARTVTFTLKGIELP